RVPPGRRTAAHWPRPHGARAARAGPASGAMRAPAAAAGAAGRALRAAQQRFLAAPRCLGPAGWLGHLGALSRHKPFFPVWSRNLRDLWRKKKKRLVGRGMGSRRRLNKSAVLNRIRKPKTFEAGGTPLFKRTPRWPAAYARNKIKKLDMLNLSKLRYFIEKGRLDTRFPITQRHLYDSRCVDKVKVGVGLYNVNDFPFPYKIDIEVAGADQSSLDMIKAVGGTVTIVYMERVGLRAHLKPWRFEVLPRTARPTLKMVHYLEKMKGRGAQVRYIKPLWLIEEERRLQTQLRELQSEGGHLAAERLARANERPGVGA
ncbi:unnamed protein product, partial [Prorocentrum cordatum]